MCGITWVPWTLLDASVVHRLHLVGPVSPKEIQASFSRVLLKCLREPGLESFVFTWINTALGLALNDALLMMSMQLIIASDNDPMFLQSRPWDHDLNIYQDEPPLKVDTLPSDPRQGCMNVTYLDYGLVERLEPTLGRIYGAADGCTSEFRANIRDETFNFPHKPRTEEPQFKYVTDTVSLAIISLKDDLKTSKWTCEHFMDLVYEREIATVHSDGHLHDFLRSQT